MADLLPSTPDTSAAEEADPRVVGLADDDADDLLSALSSTTARELLSALHEDPAPPSKLADAVDTSLQNAQYHLGNLEDAGLVEVIDTAYSSKGREMDVYAPTDRPLVVVAGDEDDGASLRTAISRFLGGLGVLSISSLVVEGMLGEWSLLGSGDDGTPLVVEDEDETGDEPAADADEEDDTTEDPDDEDAAEADDPGGDPDEEYDSEADPADEEEEDEVGVATEDEEDAEAQEEEEEEAEDDLEEADDAVDEADEGDDAVDQQDAEEDVAADETEEAEAEDDAEEVTADDVPDADAPTDSAEFLAEAPDEALGLPPGFLFFLGGAIVLTATFAVRYWRIVR